jgi:peptidoglycan L-alanyl-D-glutamate endopeptidase CwlK
MTFKFSQNSLNRLATVHPDLQRVARRALELSPVDFAITQGRRTLDEQRRLYGKGRTAAQCVRVGVPAEYARPSEAKVTWVKPENGNHLSGRALDVAPYIRGKLEYDDNGKLGLWPKIAKAFKDAARELDVSIEWGGDWEGTKDRPHFELVR